MKPADFLPSFFRQVKQAVIPGQGQVDDYRNIANDPLKLSTWDHQGVGVPLAQNLLAPDVQKPVVAPAIAPAVAPAPAIAPSLPEEIKPTVSIPYKVPMPDSDMPPLAVPSSESVNGAKISNDVARGMGHVTTSKRGRPTPLPSELDPASEEKTLAVNKAYQTYDPEAQPEKGPMKWVGPALHGLQRGFAAGGLGGLIYGTAEGAIGGATDKSRSNREWQQKKLGETGPVVAGIQRQRKIQADIEEQQAQTEQRRAAPGIAAAELGRKRDYDNERLQIQRDADAGRISNEQARIKNSDLDRKQRAEEGRLNRESAEKIAGLRPNATASAAAEGEAIAASTTAAADALKQELDQHKGQLTKNERAINQKEGLWRTEAAKIVRAKDMKMSDAMEIVKAADPDVQSGKYDQTVNNTKALRDAIADKEKRYSSMQEDIRKGSAKAARAPEQAADPLKGKKWSKSQYKGSKPVEQAAREAAARGAVVVP